MDAIKRLLNNKSPDYIEEFLNGVKLFAHWKDGVEYVGTGREAGISNNNLIKELAGEKKGQEMKKRKKSLTGTYDDVAAKKAFLMRLATKTNDPRLREDYELAINHCDRLTARITEGTKRRLKVLFVLLSLCFGGCNAGIGVGMDGSIYWPEIRTSKGGQFGDPAPSREQSTMHTTDMKRNNLPMVGGAK